MNLGVDQGTHCRSAGFRRKLVDVDDFEFEPAPQDAPSRVDFFLGKEGAVQVILIIGNAAIIALEGLVVSIQTTRLVLFEFFIRFLTARGRRFEPLTPPPASLPGGSP